MEALMKSIASEASTKGEEALSQESGERSEEAQRDNFLRGQIVATAKIA